MAMSGSSVRPAWLQQWVSRAIGESWNCVANQRSITAAARAGCSGASRINCLFQIGLTLSDADDFDGYDRDSLIAENAFVSFDSAGHIGVLHHVRQTEILPQAGYRVNGTQRSF